jgi:hypothetical protein
MKKNFMKKGHLFESAGLGFLALTLLLSRLTNRDAYLWNAMWLAHRNGNLWR